jgi:hypothetical protein
VSTGVVTTLLPGGTITTALPSTRSVLPSASTSITDVSCGRTTTYSSSCSVLKTSPTTARV